MKSPSEEDTLVILGVLSCRELTWWPLSQRIIVRNNSLVTAYRALHRVGLVSLAEREVGAVHATSFCCFVHERLSVYYTVVSVDCPFGVLSFFARFFFASFP